MNIKENAPKGATHYVDVWFKYCRISKHYVEMYHNDKWIRSCYTISDLKPL